MSTAAQQKQYRLNKLKKSLIRNEQLTGLGQNLLGILKELVRASNSNVIIGDSLMLIGTDILYKFKIVDLPTLVVIYSLILGLDLADSTIVDVGDLLSVLHGNAPHSSLGTSAHTIVYGSDSGQDMKASDLSPLLSILEKVK